MWFTTPRAGVRLRPSFVRIHARLYPCARHHLLCMPPRPTLTLLPTAQLAGVAGRLRRATPTSATRAPGSCKVCFGQRDQHKPESLLADRRASEQGGGGTSTGSSRRSTGGGGGARKPSFPHFAEDWFEPHFDDTGADTDAVGATSKSNDSWEKVDFGDADPVPFETLHPGAGDGTAGALAGCRTACNGGRRAARRRRAPLDGRCCWGVVPH